MPKFIFYPSRKMHNENNHRNYTISIRFCPLHLVDEINNHRNELYFFLLKHGECGQWKHHLNFFFFFAFIQFRIHIMSRIHIVWQFNAQKPLRLTPYWKWCLSIENVNECVFCCVYVVFHFSWSWLSMVYNAIWYTIHKNDMNERL